MNRLRLIVLVVFALLPICSGSGRPAAATVDMNRLFNEYDAAVDQRGSIDSLRERIKNDPRLRIIAETENNLKAIRAKVRDPETPEDLKKTLFEEFQKKNAELRGLRRDMQQDIDTEQAKINAKLVEMTRTLLVEIQAAVSLVAEREGYELVLESKGHTSSQVPTLLYIRESDDITDLVLSYLNGGRKLEAIPSGNRE